MTLWDAIRGLGDNPLFRLERRRQWRGSRLLVLAIGGASIFVCCCSYWSAFLLAPTLAALAVVQDKRARIWEDILLTRLTATEIVLAKLIASLIGPSLVFLLGVLVSVGFSAVMQTWMRVVTPGQSPFDVQAMGGWAAVVAVTLVTLVTAAVVLVAGGLAGICAGLYHDQTSNAIVLACLLVILLEAATAFAAIRLVGAWFPFPSFFGMGASPRAADLVPATALGLLVVLGTNGVAAAGLWHLATRAVRR